MNYGLYLSASGVLTNMYRQDVFANNLANVGTTAFKADLPVIRQRDAESMKPNVGIDASNALLDRLGGGAWAGEQSIDHAQGALNFTDRPLDVALETAETFFAIREERADGQMAIRLTRDGRFARDTNGFLVTAAGGHKVLDADDQPIFLPKGIRTEIDDAGKIRIDGDDVAQIQVAGVDDIGRLHKLGGGMFTWKGAADPRSPVDHIGLKQGHVEASAADPIQSMLQVINASKAVSANAEMIKYHDRLMDQAVNTLGRVA